MTEEDIEIVESTGDLQIKLVELTQTYEKHQASASEEMRLLLSEMDAVLKERSDQERSYGAVRRKMERSLLECQDIIDRLGRDLKASERAMLKVRGDLRVSQDRCVALEDKHANSVKAMQEEKNALNVKVSELIENYSKLQKTCEEEKQKNQANAYLKEYAEYLETQMQAERVKKEQNEFKDKVIQQLNADHTLTVLTLKYEHEEAMEKLRLSHSIELSQLRSQKPHQITSSSQSQTTTSFQSGLNSANSPLNFTFPAASAVGYANSSDSERDLFNGGCGGANSLGEDSSLLSDSLSDSMSLRRGGDNDNEVEEESAIAASAAATLAMESVVRKLNVQIGNWENLFKTIDIDTYLTQVEKQVDEKCLTPASMFKPRNDVLKAHLELSLRGIRQLCDFHSIDMEYII